MEILAWALDPLELVTRSGQQKLEERNVQRQSLKSSYISQGPLSLAYVEMPVLDRQSIVLCKCHSQVWCDTEKSPIVAVTAPSPTAPVDCL